MSFCKNPLINGGFFVFLVKENRAIESDHEAWFLCDAVSDVMDAGELGVVRA